MTIDYSYPHRRRDFACLTRQEYDREVTAIASHFTFVSRPYIIDKPNTVTKCGSAKQEI